LFQLFRQGVLVYAVIKDALGYYAKSYAQYENGDLEAAVASGITLVPVIPVGIV